MRILSFEYQDADGWTLEPMKLDAFNLLVGLSGAGKTRVVRAIERVCAVAAGTDAVGMDDRTFVLLGAKFTINFEHEGITYRWEAEFEPLSSSGPLAPVFQTERIDQQGQPLMHRAPDQFILKGQSIPRLDRTQSAIALLKEDPAMAALHTAFSRCVFQAPNSVPDPAFRSTAVFERLRQQYSSMEVLGADFSLPLHGKAELLQALFPTAFAEITEAFRDAFPLIEKLWVERFPLTAEKHYVNLMAKEAGVDHAFGFEHMSSGMQRYLSFLIHLSFAPRGTVVLIDELESSFGINCLPDAVDFLLSRAPDLQLILTSHHPYIIQKIPMDLWKIVTRKGSHVRVLDAAAIPALEESRSHLDRFTRLINLPEYEQGIQA